MCSRSKIYVDDIKHYIDILCILKKKQDDTYICITKYRRKKIMYIDVQYYLKSLNYMVKVYMIKIPLSLVQLKTHAIADNDF